MGPKSQTECSVGITTYIRDTLCGGRPFKRFIKAGVLQRGRAGLALGRSIDRAFASSIEHRPIPNKARKRVAAIINALKAAGVSPVQAQVSAKKQNISTFADAIGTTKTGETVVIELKCTTANKRGHLDIYHMCCRNQGEIVSGAHTVPNSEYVKHQLQTGFAMNAKSIRHGIVVVSCVDGAVCYPVERIYCENHWFGHSFARKIGSANKRQLATLVWPSEITCLGKIVRVIHKRVAILKKGGTAIAVKIPLSSMKTTGRRAAAKLLTCGNPPHYVVEIGHNKHWRPRLISLKTVSS